MKSSILLGLTILLSVSNVFAQNSEKVISIGKNNVESASVYGSLLHLTKKDDAEDSGKYYELSCETSNRLVLTVVNAEDSVALVAETQVKNCAQVIRDVYDIAFSEKISADFVISDKANSNGVYGLSMSYSTSK